MSTSVTASDHLLIIADIHGNWPALEAVLAAEPDVTRVLCLGDLVHYGPDCPRIVSWARGRLKEGDIVRGNHDHAAAFREPASPPGMTESLPGEMAALTQRTLPTHRKHYLGSLPLFSRLKVAGNDWHLTHGLPSDPLHGYLLQEGDPQRWEEEVLAAAGPDVLLVGHTHRPFIKTVSGTTVVNPGSVGRPKDGDPRASYAVWKEGAFDLKRIDYDRRDLLQRVRNSFSLSLAESLAHELETGGRLGCAPPP